MLDQEVWVQTLTGKQFIDIFIKSNFLRILFFFVIPIKILFSDFVTASNP